MLNTLRGKVTGLVLLVTLIATSVLAALSYQQLKTRETLAARQRLESAAHFASNNIASAFDAMIGDGAALAGMESIRSTIRAIQSPTGIDRMTGATRDISNARLQAVFTAILEARPHYTQIRLIGRANNWTELVRVDRTRSGILKIGPASMQEKGGSPYLAAISSGETGPYFSKVTYNQEYGIVTGPPTIRRIVPVKDSAGRLFAALVINADYAGLLKTAGQRFAPAFEVTAVTDTLDWMTWGPDGTTPLYFHDDPEWKTPPHSRLIGSDAVTNGPQTDAGEVVVTRQIVARSQHQPFGLYVQTSIPEATLYAPERKALSAMTTISVALILLATAAAGAVGNRLTDPLRSLTRALSHTSPETGKFDDLPTGTDEVGELADAFRRMSEDLIRQTARARAVLGGVAEGIITISDRGRIEKVNRAAEALFGYSAQEMVGHNLGMLIPDEFGDHQVHVDRAKKTPAATTVVGHREIRGRCRDGREIPLEITVSRAEYSGATHFIGLVRDISERQEAERERALMVEALKRSNAELDKFAYVASHDLKAPLRAIDTTARWLEDDLQESLTEDSRETLAMLRGRVARMERLLDDLLEHSRVGRDARPSPVVSGQALAGDLRELTDLPAGFALNVTRGFDEIRLPRMPILTVLMNLVSNAVKHHDRDDGQVTLDAIRLPGGYDISVTDDGPGIAPEYHDKVFEIFQTLRPRDKVDGSGIGLATVLKYVQLQGGWIQIDSDGTGGTRFRLFWPDPIPETRKEAAE